jgi:transcriptional regulator GlxA family with amidase domain
LTQTRRQCHVAPFIRLIGVPPMHYFASWRMQVATEKLRNTSASLAQVAEMVGYGSEAAFSHAFKKAFGYCAGYVATFETARLRRGQTYDRSFEPRGLMGVRMSVIGTSPT